MNKQTAKEFLLDYMNNHPDNQDENRKPYFDNLYDMLYEIDDIEYEVKIGSSRWWNNMFYVQEINGRLIGFDWATNNGDWSAKDSGWEFNEDSICFVEPYIETITKYKKCD
jgi:hypothetical protein